MLAHPEIEQLGNGVTREMPYDGQITVYTVENLSRDAIDTWAEDRREMIDHAASESTMRTIHIIDDASGFISPYATARIRESIYYAANVKGYTAVVVNESLTAHMVEILLRKLAGVIRTWKFRFFHTRQEAEQWLLAQAEM
jgi:hypothetical protein